MCMRAEDSLRDTDDDDNIDSAVGCILYANAVAMDNMRGRVVGEGN